MPIPQIFYLNAPSLASATAVFIDAGLTVCASNGIYSDGTITREQVGCTLLPQQDCPFCGTYCSPLGSILIGTDLGLYTLAVDTGNAPTDIGAIIIEFYPNNVPNGIWVEYNSQLYNQLSSSVFGYLAGLPGEATYVGDSSYKCSAIGSNTAVVYDVYNYTSSTWINSGSTQSLNMTTTSDKVTSVNPQKCIMVIPKLTNAVNTLYAYMIVPCIPDDASSIVVHCPSLLRSFTGSVAESDDVIRCAMPTNSTYYVAPVNGVAPYLGLYDWVFTDPYGQFKLPNGKYKTNFLNTPNDTIEVQNGVIIAITQTC